MNINVLLLHISKSNLDDAIKSNLASILDKAIHDGDTVARLEDRIKGIENRLKEDLLSLGHKHISEGALKMFKEILHGDKPDD